MTFYCVFLFRFFFLTVCDGARVIVLEEERVMVLAGKLEEGAGARVTPEMVFTTPPDTTTHTKQGD